jgi:hypothetical protein
MKNLIPELVKEMNKQFKDDARKKGQMNESLERQLVQHKNFEQLRADWAEKRVVSIFKELERYGIKVTGAKDSGTWRGTVLQATCQTVDMEGELRYQQMDMLRPFKPWRRPKIVATFWVLDSNKERCYLEGHQKSALMVVFGAKRMLTYNRLAPAFLSAIAR